MTSEDSMRLAARAEFAKAFAQAHEVLKYAEYPEPRARLGYYYATC